MLLCFLCAAGDAQRMRGHLTPIVNLRLPLAVCTIYRQDTFGNGGARFISPAGYLQLNSWHLHKYLVVEALRLISAPCKVEGHANVRVSAASTLRSDVSVLQFAADAATQHSTTTTAGNKGHLSKRETAVSRAEEPSPADHDKD